MSKELKIRAWNNKDKIWAIGSEVYLRLDGKSIAEIVSDKLAICRVDNNEDIVIEQYTGLKDKNGKEVYEGDIIKQTWFNGDDGDITIIGVVGFDEEEASFGIVQTIQKTNEQYSGFYSQREVIGNIHENSNLLKENKK